MPSRKVAQEIQHLNNIDNHLSLFWCNKAWTDYVLTIRRVSDDAETNVYYNQSVGFVDDNSLTSDGVTTVLSWIGASTAYIASWRDIGGKGNDVVRTTASQQPQLVLNGAGVVAEVDFLTGGKLLTKSFTAHEGIATSFFLVIAPRENPPTHYFYSNADTFGNNDSQLFITGAFVFYYKTNTGAIGAPSIGNADYDSNNLISIINNGVDRITGYKNGVNGFDLTKIFLNRQQRYGLGINSGGYAGFHGKIQELLMIKGEFVSEEKRQMIDRELMTRHGISS